MPQALAPLWEGFRRLADPRSALPVTRGTGVEPVTVAAFPAGILQQKAELYLGGSWLDVTSYLYARDGVTITRGRADESGQVDPSRCRFTVDNRDGRWSPRNPRGAWYGALTRNTPYRHSVKLGDSRLWMPTRTQTGTYCGCPDTPALSITGDLDLRIDLDLGSWFEETTLLCKRSGASSGISWDFRTGFDGLLNLTWSTGGTTATDVTVSSTIPVPYPSCGRKAVRATLDVDNGAGGYTVTFYTADEMDGTFVQLGDAVATSAGTTSIFDSTAGLRIGPYDGSTAATPMTVYEAQVRSGIGGTRVASPDFTGQTDTVSSVTDSQGNGWSVAGDAQITPWRTRFCGELSQFPVRWDTSGTDVYVPLEASGLLRRLQQGSSPLRSSMYREAVNDANLVAYWPCEDGDDTDSIGPADGIGGRRMRVSGTTDYAYYDGFKCSGALPVPGSSTWYGPVGTYTTTGQTSVRWLQSTPVAGTVNGAPLVSVYCTGTAAVWDVTYGTGGNLAVNTSDRTGSSLGASGALAAAINGTDMLMQLTLTENGADVDWSLSVSVVASGSTSFYSGTVAASTVGRVTQVVVNRGGSTLGNVVFGHIMVATTDDTMSVGATSAPSGWYAEDAASRIERLCTEEGIPFRLVGDWATSARLGYQGQKALVDLLAEAANADEGVLFELRDVAGFGYRSGRSLAAQDPRVSFLDYAEAHLDDFQPTDDDQAVRNDVTITRDGGASFRAVQASGTLGTDSVGVYDTSDTLSLAWDDAADDHAWWRVHVGTVDETRFPQIGVRLENTRVNFFQALQTSLLDVEVGEVLTVTNPPEWLPPGTIREIVQGATETLSNFGYQIGYACTPAAVYDIPVLATTTATDGDRLCSGFSTLTAPIGVPSAVFAVESIQVSTTAGAPAWDTVAAGYSVFVGGEEMAVLSVTGTSSPQTFSVSRAVNGVMTAHPAGAAFDVTPTYLGL